ncbi:MAG: hypothetical protein M3O50_03835 [Myxococcota bacterium]|nr:hypothetical protein [Myxococcota bacterium]
MLPARYTRHASVPAHRWRPSRAPALALVAACSLAAAGCGATAPESRSPDRDVPAYAGRFVELFDDAIEPSAVGFNLGTSTPPDHDRLLRERAQIGDAVVRARVTTVTSKDQDNGRSWQMGLRTVERIAGAGPLPPDFTLTVDPRSPTAGILRAFESRLIGRTFVAFVREFRRAEERREDAELHFHLAHDGTDEVNAVLAAALQSTAR